MLAPWGRGMLGGLGAVVADSIAVTGAVTAGTVAATTALTIAGVDSDTYVKTRVDAGKDPLLPAHDAATGSAISISGRAYARYVGKRTKIVTTVDAHVYRATAAAAGTGWAEIAVATGELETIAGIAGTDLTVVGYASIDTEVKAGGLAVISKTIGSLSIPANTGIWIIVAGAYDTTQASYRTVEEVMGLRVKDATQPSTIVGVPTSFVGSTAAQAIPWMKAFIA
jgi:hypothetical protein